MLAFRWLKEFPRSVSLPFVLRFALRVRDLFDRESRQMKKALMERMVALSVGTPAFGREIFRPISALSLWLVMALRVRKGIRRKSKAP